MKEYIEREALVKHLNARLNYATQAMGGCSDYVFGFSDGFERVKDFPAADVVERKRGEWETVGVGITERTRCSNCKSTKGSWSKPPFCNQCGADMRGEKPCGE